MYFYAFYPLGLDLPLRCRPWLSWTLIASMVVTFAWQRYAPQVGGVPPADLMFWPGNGSPFTVLTAIFLHGSWWHLIGNLVYLGVFAPALEDRLGRVRFLLLFLMLGAAGNLAHGYVAIADLLGQGGLGVMGASGAISGLLGIAMVRLSYAHVAVGYWVFAPLAGQNRAGRQRLPLPVAVLSWLLLQLVHTAVARESAATISYGAHLGGFGLGVLLGLVLGYAPLARAEGALQRARHQFRVGNALAATGAYEEYLNEFPEDRDARREMARAEVLAGQRGEALARYREIYREALTAGQVPVALDVFREARHVRRGAGLTAPELAELASWFERCLAYPEAVGVYQDLVDLHPGAAECGRAWVRIVTLLGGVLGRADEAQAWLAQARDRQPEGAWRDYLLAEFTPAAARRGGPAPDPAGWRQAPAT
jgi:membrane associated rhomboid family serine protease